MSWQPTRDLVGYGANPPDPKWPDGARIAVNFVVNYEEGSEPSVQDGEGYSETGLTESSTSSQGLKGRDLAAEGMFEFGSRVGFWRIMRAFQERGLPLTVFGCALALERNKPAAEAIRKSGFDVCCHGWRWVRHFQLSEAEEREHIAKAVKSLKQTVGAAPAGWYCRYGPSVNTRRLLLEHGGFTYDSDYYGEELPFWQTVEGKPHLIVPYSLTNNDGKYAAGMTTADQWFTLCRDAFDVLYKEGATRPQDDVGRPAPAPDRPSRPHSGIVAPARLYPAAEGRLGHPPAGYRKPLEGHASLSRQGLERIGPARYHRRRFGQNEPLGELANEDHADGQEDPRQLRERLPGHQGQPCPHPDARPAGRLGQDGDPAGRPGLRARPGPLLRAQPGRLRSALPLPARDRRRAERLCRAARARSRPAPTPSPAPSRPSSSSTRPIAVDQQGPGRHRLGRTTRCGWAARRSASRSIRARKTSTR